MFSKEIYYYGSEQALPASVPLRAGPLELIFEGGDLRYIQLDGREIIRRVYVAVRDRHWNTIPGQIDQLQLDVQPDRFDIHFAVSCHQGEIDFPWQAHIHGDPQGGITYQMQGEARTSFWRNRIGLCVLHPMRECAGLACQVEHSDGRVEQAVFPEWIAPHQPFKDLGAITHTVLPGLQAQVRFVGEVFETEDQRNWTDASFKTYSTPLELPYPVLVQPGEQIRQSVELHLIGDQPARPRRRSGKAGAAPISLELGKNPWVKVPSVGLAVAAGTDLLASVEIERLKSLHLAHLRVDLDLSAADYTKTLRQAWKQGEALGVALEVALHLSTDLRDELARFVQVCQEVRPQVARWVIFQQRKPCMDPAWASLARRTLVGLVPSALMGTGADTNFTELNRNRPEMGFFDFIGYALNPQVHAFDNRSLVETLAGQAATVVSARRIAGDKPVVVGPVTLRPRASLPAGTLQDDRFTDELPVQVDPRQMSLLGAGWTLGSVASLAESGAAGLTYYETSGWCGVLVGPGGSLRSDRFHAMPHSVFPLYHVLADINEFSAGWIFPVDSQFPLELAAVGLGWENRRRMLVANLTSARRSIQIRGLTGPVWLTRLDEYTVQQAVQAPEKFRLPSGERQTRENGDLSFRLNPYGLVKIDFQV